MDTQLEKPLVVEEEALSLSDLPLHSNKSIEENEQDFDFEVVGGSLSSLSEMCSADDIFFQGQILPFRTSINSNPKSQCLSRSESSIEAFSSRSSSSRSQLSSSSSSSSSSRLSRPRIQNQFFSTHSSSSPKPQIRIPNSSIGNRNRKSSAAWEFFRLSLVHTPEIELQDLKARNSVSRNSSSTSSSSNSNNNNNSKKQGKQSMMLTGCNCTVNSVKAVPYIKIKNQEIEEKKKQEQVEIIKKKKKKKKEKGKEGMSNHRTFDWIKELSNSNFVDQEEGHNLGIMNN